MKKFAKTQNTDVSVSKKCFIYEEKYGIGECSTPLELECAVVQTNNTKGYRYIGEDTYTRDSIYVVTSVTSLVPAANLAPWTKLYPDN